VAASRRVGPPRGGPSGAASRRVGAPGLARWRVGMQKPGLLPDASSGVAPSGVALSRLVVQSSASQRLTGRVLTANRATAEGLLAKRTA